MTPHKFTLEADTDILLRDYLRQCPVKQTQYVAPMPVYCWSSVVDGGPPLARHWFNAVCLAGMMHTFRVLATWLLILGQTDIYLIKYPRISKYCKQCKYPISDFIEKIKPNTTTVS